jgi:hypothetical protein
MKHIIRLAPEFSLLGLWKTRAGVKQMSYASAAKTLLAGKMAHVLAGRAFLCRFLLTWLLFGR